jgi:hypothetical protein
MNANKATGPLGERLLAFLDDGVSPVTAEEARARSGSEPRRHTDVRRQPRRSRLLLTIGFAALVIVGVFAVVSVSRRGHSASPITHPPPNRGRQVFVARLVPEGHASTEQLDSASGVLLRRLQLLGDQGAEAEVSGGSILLTTSGEVQKLRSGLSLLVSPGELLFRPVLCAVPAYSPRVIGGKSATAPGPLPTACPPQYQLTAANLNVNTDTGQPQNSVAPWPALANFPSTPLANDDPAHTVLLRTAADSGFAGERLLLGPAQVDDAQISSAQATFDSPDWLVNLNLDSTGSRQWDALATQQFHAYVGIDLDAYVVSAPLTLPGQSTFTSFGGKVQISGNFTRATADDLANELESGPLPVVLRAEPAA